MQQALEEFVEKDLMLFLDHRYLSLALPKNPNFELSSVAAPAVNRTSEWQESTPSAHAATAAAGPEVGD